MLISNAPVALLNNTDIFGIILDPKRFAVHDGPGIRTTFFLKGCPLRCHWCHNPESFVMQPQMAYYEHKCIDCGECGEVCPVKAHENISGKHKFNAERCINCGECESVCLGKAMKLYGKRVTVAEALDIALTDRAFYQESNGGVTLSGGEPLLQPEFTLALLTALKMEHVHTALDTCAAVAQQHLQSVLAVTDLFLVDFKVAESESHYQFTGQTNEQIIKNLRFLAVNGANIEIRIPLVPDYNDSDANLHKTGAILRDLKIKTVKLLPYHALARTKYAALHLIDTMPQVSAPDSQQLDQAREILKLYDLQVNV